MYAVDELDKVLELFDLPQASVAEPAPIVLSGMDAVAVAYVTQRSANLGCGNGYAVVTFTGARAHWCGAPGDRALAAHPLYPLGLEHYSFCEILASSLTRALCRMYGEAPEAAGEFFRRNRHFVMTFRDSTFECIAEGYECAAAEGAPEEIVSHMTSALKKRDGARVLQAMT